MRCEVVMGIWIVTYELKGKICKDKWDDDTELPYIKNALEYKGATHIKIVHTLI